MLLETDIQMIYQDINIDKYLNDLSGYSMAEDIYPDDLSGYH